MEVFQGSHNDHSTLAPIKPNRKRFVILAVVIIGLLIAAAIAYYFLIYKQPQQSANSQSQEDQVVIEDKPIIKVIYGFGTSFESSADVFYRDFIEESERESLFEIKDIGSVPFNSFGSNLMGFNLSKGFAVVVDEKEIWFSQDGEKAERIYSHAEASKTIRLINSVINLDASQVAFAVLNDTTKVADLWLLDVKTKTAKLLTPDIKTAPFAWANNNKTIYLGPNIITGDGTSRVPTALSVANGQQEPLFTSDSPFDFGAYNMSSDGNYSAYIKPTIDKNKRDASTFQGYYVGKPYKIFIRSTNGGQTSEVKDLNTDQPPTSLIFDHLGKNLYWAEDKIIYQFNLESGETNEIFKSEDEAINVLYAATSTQLVIGSQLPDKTYAVYIIGINDRKQFMLMETTDATSAIGLVIER